MHDNTQQSSLSPNAYLGQALDEITEEADKALSFDLRAWLDRCVCAAQDLLQKGERKKKGMWV